MIGHYCLECWLGECQQVQIAHVAPFSVVDCHCCRLVHDWTNAEVDLFLAPTPAGVTPSAAAQSLDSDPSLGGREPW